MSEHGREYYKSKGRIIWGYPKTGEVVFVILDRVAICFSMFVTDGEICTVIHKHGNIDFVNSWAESARNKYKEKGLIKEAQEIFMVTSDNWNLDDVNRFLTCSGSLTNFLITTGNVEIVGDSVGYKMFDLVSQDRLIWS